MRANSTISWAADRRTASFERVEVGQVSHGGEIVHQVFHFGVDRSEQRHNGAGVVGARDRVAKYRRSFVSVSDYHRDSQVESGPSSGHCGVRGVGESHRVAAGADGPINIGRLLCKQQQIAEDSLSLGQSLRSSDLVAYGEQLRNVALGGIRTQSGVDHAMPQPEPPCWGSGL